MQEEINQKRIQNIYLMLFEMARGNFTSRIQRTERDDELEALIVLVNMVAEEMKESVFHSGFINPHYTYSHLVQSSILLDQDFNIKTYTHETATLLGFTTQDYKNQPFSNLLSEESKITWNCVIDSLLEEASYSLNVQLNYITPEQLLVPCYCIVSRLMHSTDIIISSVTTEKGTHPFDTFRTSTSTEAENMNLLPRNSDVQLIQQVYDYILEHLESPPLPSLKELSRIFGTNEYKLKNGFKLLFKTSIYQFYNTERLKRAHLLIQQTTIPLKTIAFMIGFSTYPNFSKAFKKTFGYAPNDIKRR